MTAPPGSSGPSVRSPGAAGTTLCARIPLESGG
jgi:hypothetical protein